ncbi:MAG: hypothetical protein ABSC38_08030 [Verrucomicrobiia bacterium]
MANKLGRAKFYDAHVDLKLLDANDRIVGEIRVKPNGILWAPKGAKKWYGVDLPAFAKFMEQKRKRWNM